MKESRRLKEERFVIQGSSTSRKKEEIKIEIILQYDRPAGENNLRIIIVE